MMEARIIAYVLIGIFLGPVASLAITPLFCLLRKLFYVPFIRKSLQEKAERKGNVVEAHLLKSHNIRNYDADGIGMPTMEDMGTYSYEVNGKSYRYRLLSTTGIPKNITLYYIKNPRKATLDNDLGNGESPWLRYYLIISVLIAVVTIILELSLGTDELSRLLAIH